MAGSLAKPSTQEAPLLEEGRLARVWQLRHSGRVADAYDLYLGILGEANLTVASKTTADSWQAFRQKGLSQDESWQLLLLGISFLRHKRQAAEAAARCAEIEQIAQEQGLRLTSTHLLQTALNHLGAGKHSAALEAFLQAKRQAESPMERNIASFNAILCMEELGLEYGPSLESFLRDFQAFDGQPWAAPFFGQIDALRLRSAFRSGEQASLREILGEQLRGEQSLYFAAWLSELPHFGLADTSQLLRERFTAQLEAAGLGYHSGYRLRTLNGLLIEEDLASGLRLGEKIERLYLWTWRFLAKPEAGLLDKILLVQKNIRGEARFLSGDDFRLLDLSIRWLGLFAGLTAAEQDRLLSPIAHAESRELRHLTFERRLIDYLGALRSCSRFSADLKADLLCPSQRFGLLGAAIAGEKKLGLLSETLAIWEAGSQDNEVRVEVLKRVVTVGREEFPSEPLTLLLDLFRSDDHVNKLQVMQHLFGIRQFDPVVHDPRLANLLSKANRTLEGYGKFSTKGEQVIARLERARISFRECDAHTLAFTRVKLDSLFTQESSTPSPAPQLPEKAWLSRADVESELRVSRATAARILKAGVERGKVESRGMGKNTLYRILDSTLLGSPRRELR